MFAELIKTFYNDYAKKGVVRFVLKNDNNEPIENVIPNSITYPIQTVPIQATSSSESELGNTTFSGDELNLVSDFHATENAGEYEFNVFFSPFKKEYNLVSSDGNLSFKWYSGFGYNSEYRTDTTEQYNEETEQDDQIYYRLVFSNEITSQETVINEFRTDSYWVIYKNINDGEEEQPIYRTKSSSSNKLTIPVNFYALADSLESIAASDADSLERHFLIANNEAESDDIISIDEIVLSYNNNENISLEDVDFITQQTFNPLWKDYDLFPTFSPKKYGERTRKLEFDTGSLNDINSFMTKIIPAKDVSFITLFDDSNGSSSSSEEESSSSGISEDKSGKTEFVSKVSLFSFERKDENDETTINPSLFFKSFNCVSPSTNYFVTINSTNEGGVVTTNILLYQAIYDGHDYVKGPAQLASKVLSGSITNRQSVVLKQSITLNPEENSELPNKREIMDFVFDGQLYLKFSSVEFLVENTVVQYDLNNYRSVCSFDYFMRNGKFIEFTKISEEQNFSIPENALMDYLEKIDYVNEKYYILSCRSSSGALSSANNYVSGVPSFVESEIIYFSKPVTIENSGMIYIKNMLSSPRLKFKTRYTLEKINESNTLQTEDVYFDNIIFEKVEISENVANIGTVNEENEESSSSGTDDSNILYPYIFDSQDTYDNNNIQVVMPGEVQEETDDLACLTMPDENKLDGEYYKFQFPFGAKIKLRPETIIVSGISSKSNGSEIALNAKNANGNYLLISGEGSNRVYKHEDEEYYIKRYNSEQRWCITTSLYGQDSNNILILTSNSDSYMNNPASEFQNMNWGEYQCSISNLKLTYVAEETESGKQKNYYLRFYDKYGNVSEICTVVTEIYQVAPYDAYIKVTGSSGSQYYTGMFQKYGRFLPSEFVEITFSAKSRTSLMYRFSQSNCSLMSLDYEYKRLPESGKKTLIVKLMPSTSRETLLNKDLFCNITIEFLDDAGNDSSVTAQIKFITQLHRTENLNLLEESENYSHELYSVNNTTSEKLSRKRISTTEFYRSWNEIWFPESHGSPLKSDKSIDEVEALRIADLNNNSGGELTIYDKLSKTGNDLSKDADGRFIQNMNAWDKTKKYPANLNKLGLNSGEDDYKYWIIDNTGNLDFKLEFEVFDFDGQETTIPANYSSPYEGDCLVVYDASAVGCTSEDIDENGNVVYKLEDSSKLKQLFALKGSYVTNANNPFRLLSDEITGNLVPADSGFITPSINSTSRICLIPFSDSQGERSGFKLKSGPKHWLEYINYESIEKLGEFWVHNSPETKNGDWQGCSQLQMNYSYYESFATIDREESTVKFDTYQNNIVTGTFTHYLYLYTDGTNSYPFSYFFAETYPKYTDEEEIPMENTGDVIKTFMLYNDDLVDYSEPSFYVIYSGEKPNKTAYYNFANYRVENEGRLSSNYIINKDTGILTFSGLTPLGRFSGDYYYHTFYRLTSDGYGDLSFYNQTLVPASANDSYTDYTWVDLKIVNEGTNQLTNGTLKFLARGYITAGTVVDTVLDNNRPWDVQMGTVAETVNRTGAVYSESYNGLGGTSRSEAINAIKSQTLQFGTLDAKSSKFVRVFWCIATNEQGTGWIDCTRGEKLFSAELSGKFYVFTSGA